MNILIVHAHPEPQSFSSSMCKTAIDILESNNHQVEVSDLYKMQFNPVASTADFHDPKNPDYLVYALEQRHAYESGTISDDIKTEIDKVLACDMLILNFPIFWFSVPAILKGWIDRVFISGAFYGGKRIYANGGMKNKKAMLAVTLGSPEYMFGKNAIHGEIGVMLNHINQGTLGYVGMQVLQPFYAYHIPYLSDEGRAAVLEKWQTELNSLEKRASLPMPDLHKYDERFRPIG